MPITYQGDTDDTIKRRAQWIEGAKKEGNLDWWGILSPGDGIKVIAEFNKVYPFIKADYWRGSPVEIEGRVGAEYAAGRLRADIILGVETYNYSNWRKIGMLEKFTDFIPRIEKMDKRMCSRHDDWCMPGNNVSIPTYNTKIVATAEAPKNWEDLLDPKWKGQIAVQPVVTPWYTLALAEGGWGIKKTEDFLARLKQQQPIYASSYSSGHALMVAGEAKIMSTGFWTHVKASQDKGAPCEWVKANPLAVTGPAFILQKKAPHPNASRLFLEWLFSPQGLIAYDNMTYYGVVFPGSGTRAAKAAEGLNLAVRTEETVQQAIELGLIDRFQVLLGISKGVK